jgi:hypothetical protein
LIPQHQGKKKRRRKEGREERKEGGKEERKLVRSTEFLFYLLY